MLQEAKMKTGKCPKCNSKEIYKRPTFSPPSNFAIGNLALGFFSQLRFHIYICTRCGYLEAYITDSEDLKEIKKKWQRVEE